MRAAIAILLLAAGPAAAGKAKVLFDPVSPAPDHYRIQWSTDSSFPEIDPGVTGEFEAPGDASGLTMDGLPDCVELWFRVKAVGEFGQESETWSNLTAPAWANPEIIRNTGPAEVFPGQTVTMALEGRNFRPNANLIFPGNAWTPENPTDIDTDLEIVSYTVDSCLAIGAVVRAQQGMPIEDGVTAMVLQDDGGIVFTSGETAVFNVVPPPTIPVVTGVTRAP